MNHFHTLRKYSHFCQEEAIVYSMIESTFKARSLKNKSTNPYNLIKNHRTNVTDTDRLY